MLEKNDIQKEKTRSGRGKRVEIGMWNEVWIPDLDYPQNQIPVKSRNKTQIWLWILESLLFSSIYNKNKQNPEIKIEPLLQPLVPKQTPSDLGFKQNPDENLIEAVRTKVELLFKKTNQN